MAAARASLVDLRTAVYDDRDAAEVDWHDRPARTQRRDQGCRGSARKPLGLPKRILRVVIFGADEEGRSRQTAASTNRYSARSELSLNHPGCPSGRL